MRRLLATAVLVVAAVLVTTQPAAPGVAFTWPQPAVVAPADRAAGTLPGPVPEAPAPTVVDSAPMPRPVATPAPAPPALGCRAAFYFPRLGICMDWTDYTDRSGVEDVGAGLRRLTINPGTYWLAAHNWTAFGAIRGARVGDEVVVRGTSYHLTASMVGPFTAPHAACGTFDYVLPAGAVYLQTSLDSCHALVWAAQ